VQRTKKVAAQTLDALVDCHVASADTFAVKMDVQGSEGAVLDGGPKALDSCAVLELELAVIPSYEGELLAPDLLARVFAHGFRLALVENVLQDNDGCCVAVNGVFVRG
jgi:hypothetical protein